MVDTDDEIYGYVSGGTRPHAIRPKRRGGVLAFKGKYRAKTRPGVLGSFAGGSSGDAVFTQAVQHPGTQARNFDKLIFEKRKIWYNKQMQAAMKRAVQKSGHAI